MIYLLLEWWLSIVVCMFAGGQLTSPGGSSKQEVGLLYAPRRGTDNTSWSPTCCILEKILGKPWMGALTFWFFADKLGYIYMYDNDDNVLYNFIILIPLAECLRLAIIVLVIFLTELDHRASGIRWTFRRKISGLSSCVSVWKCPKYQL
jgi:hypothetical protein